MKKTREVFRKIFKKKFNVIFLLLFRFYISYSFKNGRFRICDLRDSFLIIFRKIKASNFFLAKNDFREKKLQDLRRKTARDNRKFPLLTSLFKKSKL